MGDTPIQQNTKNTFKTFFFLTNKICGFWQFSMLKLFSGCIKYVGHKTTIVIAFCGSSKPSAAKAIYCHGRPRTTAIRFNRFHYFSKNDQKKKKSVNKCINRNKSITTTRTAQNTHQIQSVWRLGKQMTNTLLASLPLTTGSRKALRKKEARCRPVL